MYLGCFPLRRRNFGTINIRDVVCEQIEIKHTAFVALNVGGAPLLNNVLFLRLPSHFSLPRAQPGKEGRECEIILSGTINQGIHKSVKYAQTQWHSIDIKQRAICPHQAGMQIFNEKFHPKKSFWWEILAFQSASFLKWIRISGWVN